MGAITHYLDITDCVDEKIKLIRFHNSQLQKTKFDRMMQVCAEYRALQLNLSEKYVETYHKIDIDDKCGTQDLLSSEYEEKYQKQVLFYWILVKWNKCLLDDKRILQPLIRQGYTDIAIYGFAELGQLLLLESHKSDINVLYILDREKYRENNSPVEIYKPVSDLPKVDAVVVTAVAYYDKIKEELEKLGYDNILSLRDIVENC
jgi:hypothetical protein